MSARLPSGQVWGLPIALAVISAVGLLAALLGDDWWDVVSWLALGIPVVVSFWALCCPRGRAKRPKP